MRFPERFRCGSRRVSEVRWKRYWDHLDDIGVLKGQPLRELLGRDVFHDGRMLVSVERLPKRLVVVYVENVVAMDAIRDILKRSPLAKSVRRADFKTALTFTGVDRLEIQMSRCYSVLRYHSANIARKGDGFECTIYVREADERPGTIRIICGSMDVEDIAVKIRSYMPRGIAAQRILGYSRREAISGNRT